MKLLKDKCVIIIVKQKHTNQTGFARCFKILILKKWFFVLYRSLFCFVFLTIFSASRTDNAAGAGALFLLTVLLPWSWFWSRSARFFLLLRETPKPNTTQHPHFENLK